MATFRTSFGLEMRHEETAERWIPRPDGGVKKGEWWRLGNHVLYCGDTSKANEEFGQMAAMMDEGVSVAFADPPYGVGVDTWDEALYWEHDYLTDIADVVLVTPGTTHLDAFFREKTRMPYRWTFAAHLTNGMTRGKTGFANWIPTCLFARPEVKVYRGGQDHYSLAIRPSLSDGLRHKGRKPREFVAWLLHLYGKPGTWVVDPFGGTGGTIIQAEEQGLRCFIGEADPEYATNILRRWATFTGDKQPCHQVG